jgi:hypothetical protein
MRKRIIKKDCIMNIDKIIEMLELNASTSEVFSTEKTTTNWEKGNGVLISIKNAWDIINALKTLTHYKDTTLGLWATDRPDKVSDPDGILFQLKDET